MYSHCSSPKRRSRLAISRDDQLLGCGSVLSRAVGEGCRKMLTTIPHIDAFTLHSRSRLYNRHIAILKQFTFMSVLEAGIID